MLFTKMSKRKFNFNEQEDNIYIRPKKTKLYTENIVHELEYMKQNVIELHKFIHKMNIQLNHNIQILYNLLNFRVYNIENLIYNKTRKTPLSQYNYFS